MSLVAPADVRTSVDLALRGKRRDLGSIVFKVGLLGTLLLALAVLLILLVSTLITACVRVAPEPSEPIDSTNRSRSTIDRALTSTGCR